jgi:hypothetical protein
MFNDQYDGIIGEIESDLKLVIGHEKLLLLKLEIAKNALSYISADIVNYEKLSIEELRMVINKNKECAKLVFNKFQRLNQEEIK